MHVLNWILRKSACVWCSRIIYVHKTGVPAREVLQRTKCIVLCLRLRNSMSRRRRSVER